MRGIGIVVAALLWMGISYPGMADTKGWKRGAWVGSFGWYALFGMGVLGLVSILWHGIGFIWLIAIIIGGFFIAFVATILFRSNAQLVALLGPIASVVWFLSYALGGGVN